MVNFYRSFLTFLFLFTIAISAHSQDAKLQIFQKYILEQDSILKPDDVLNLHINKSFKTNHNQITHVYISQKINGIRIANSSYSVAFDENQNIKHAAGKFFSNLSPHAAQPSIALDQAMANALQRDVANINIQISETSTHHKFKTEINGNGFNHKGIAELAYYMTKEKELKLVWIFDSRIPKTNHWFNFYIDAVSGKILRREDWNLSCNVEEMSLSANGGVTQTSSASSAAQSAADGSAYRVFPFPVESPNHGSRQLVLEPANATASPFGWHDTDGIPGAEYTITRGNNVYAYEDINDMDEPGISPDGGAELLFDYSYIASQMPDNYLDAATTNLFYVNNRIHDILFNYGFDEAAGNFQAKNYSGEGEEDDYVLAECQDGGGFNNANMATPPDGYNPVMQMYLWQRGQLDDMLIVNSPSSIAGSYTTSNLATFGPAVPEGGITANLALLEDDSGQSLGCSPVVNSSELTGKIVLVIRGECNFTEKVLRAQNAGAVACIIINNVAGLVNPGGEDDNITIPSFIINKSDGDDFIALLETGTNINATITGLGGDDFIDGSFDNGVITHEYIHGLSTRLTGGSDNSWCLLNEEQMGEGWSDWFALMFTMNMEAENPVYRPMATFAAGQSTTGNGIRPVPYDTSFTTNSYTYAHLNNSEITVPHGVGFIWSTMLWDLTWAFIEEYGFDEDVINGTGGNNILLQLVVDGLKIQPCEPGFVDARDAILAADQINNNGENKCLIWEVFAKRGLGYSASQGSSDSRSDGIAAFDLPPACMEVFYAPIANFEIQNAQSCHGVVSFHDLSENIPQSWLWDFGDGHTSTDQNPIHSYDQPGIYSVSLTVQNNEGEDVKLLNDIIHYTLPDEVDFTEGASGCVGDTVVLSAAVAQGVVVWQDENHNDIGTGNELEVILENATATYYALAEPEPASPMYVGPQDESIGEGMIHGSTFIGTVEFEVHQPIVLQSVYVYSGNVGNRNIKLWKGNPETGQVVESQNIPIAFTGGGRIELNMEIDIPGVYNLGMAHANLYRNESGVNYPYTLENFITITGSSAGPEYYYYFYDFEITPKRCLSNGVEVMAEVIGNAQFEMAISGLEVEFTAPEAQSWHWDFGDGNESVEQNPIHIYQEEGSYTVALTANDCYATRELNLVQIGVENIHDKEFNIYPNPVSDLIHIENKTNYKINHYVLRDITGKVILTQAYNPYVGAISISHISQGAYILELQDENGKAMHREKIWILK